MNSLSVFIAKALLFELGFKRLLRPVEEIRKLLFAFAHNFCRTVAVHFLKIDKIQHSSVIVVESVHALAHGFRVLAPVKRVYRALVPNLFSLVRHGALFAEKIYPNAKFKDIRGNVDTRLKKLLNGEYDALVLAKAGLERLDLCNGEDYTVTPFDADEFLPAPCQGIVAIESRKNSEVSKMLAEISDKNTMLSFETERQVLHSLNADCSTPVGAISRVENDRITLSLSADCKKTVSGTDEISNRIKLAKRLVSKIE